jgi:anaerobic magnesium-protoporphyrin IX monomethyl ester cyclase
MTSVLLIYPFFQPRRDRSPFRFPPLGVAYLAAALRQAGHEVRLLDCTFLDRAEAIDRAIKDGADVVGVYCMVTMQDDALRFSAELRGRCRLLVAGGPLPTCAPDAFLGPFDVVVRGEGEQAMLDLLGALEAGAPRATLAGIIDRDGSHAGPGPEPASPTSSRPDLGRELDTLPFPARDLLPNESYIQHGKVKYGYSITTVMSTRGCPFRCDFCSNVVYGASYRERSAGNVLDEIEGALRLGYDRISFADDVFTLHRRRVIELCEEIQRRGLRFAWECLGRVDSMDPDTAAAMVGAGCTRIYFGIESGDDRILALMNKHITVEQARRAVETAHRAGLEVGAFFILFYPGETNETVLNTLRLATSLPLDYIGLTLPYPLPGTTLHERIKDRITRDWRPGENLFTDHVLIFDSEFSETKMRLGLLKGRIQFEIRRRLGRLAPLALKLFEPPTDALLTALK